MTRIVTISACFIPATALAHIGHIGGLAGHDHWVIAAAAVAALKGSGAEASEENEPELQEA
tara:strand:+ start:570 stop:752 length:183 start_codon:yes stop_codon:yes gene_type:complete